MSRKFVGRVSPACGQPRELRLRENSDIDDGFSLTPAATAKLMIKLLDSRANRPRCAVDYPRKTNLGLAIGTADLKTDLCRSTVAKKGR